MRSASGLRIDCRAILPTSISPPQLPSNHLKRPGNPAPKSSWSKLATPSASNTTPRASRKAASTGSSASSRCGADGSDVRSRQLVGASKLGVKAGSGPGSGNCQQKKERLRNTSCPSSVLGTVSAWVSPSPPARTRSCETRLGSYHWLDGSWGGVILVGKMAKRSIFRPDAFRQIGKKAALFPNR